MDDSVLHLINEAEAAFVAAKTLRELDAARVQHLGKSSPIKQLKGALRQLDPSEIPARARALNDAENRIQITFDLAKSSLAERDLDARLAAERQDMTLPPRPFAPGGTGGIHPISRTMAELTAIFGAMGFKVVEGPDIEGDWYNFAA
ncbi:MAG: phenylalanine--tRNA ligase subunit alpha, partial [Rubritepida sp.]|nr:phenylalanine--tRNA ligase subunit alpha [Rubritepida sp.]